MYNVSEWSDSPDLASMHPCDLVGPLAGTDTCSLRFESSMMPRWVWMVGGLSGMDGWWFGCLRYVCCPAVAPSVLTRFACSQRCHFNSLWVVACATHCTILTTSSTTYLYHCHRRSSGALDHLDRLPTRPARLYGLVARYVDTACSFQHHAHFCHSWDVFHHIQRC